MNHLTVVWDKSLTTLKVGDTAVATVTSGGVPVPISVSCVWAIDQAHLGIVEIAQSQTQAGVSHLLCKAVGTTTILALTRSGTTVTGLSDYMTVTVAPQPVAAAAPLGNTVLNHQSVCMVNTNFYYDTWLKRVSGVVAPDAMEIAYAHMYDVMLSGDREGRVDRLHAVNPNLRFIPYALLLSTLVNGPLTGDPTKDKLEIASRSLETKYLDDFDRFCANNGVSSADKEAAFLHAADGTRLSGTVFGSVRNVGDPRNAIWRSYSVNRMVRIASPAKVASIFLDEYGTGALSMFYKGSTAIMSDLAIAETSLVRECRDALMKLSTPKQLVANTANYVFSWDDDIAKAALGVHMEQTNNPLSGNLVQSYWPWIDKMLAAGVWINMVPPYQFGEYESQVGKTGTQHMDTVRGKFLELASYYMVVPKNPSMVGLSIENGLWSKFTPTQNYVPAVNVGIGYATGARTRNLLPATTADNSTHAFARPFTNGLVVFQPIWYDVWNRSSQDFGPTNAVNLKLPTDRTYYRVHEDGSVALAPSTTVTLRTPEAAIFVCKP